MSTGLLVRIDEAVIGRLWLDDRKRFSGFRRLSI